MRKNFFRLLPIMYHRQHEASRPLYSLLKAMRQNPVFAKIAEINKSYLATPAFFSNRKTNHIPLNSRNADRVSY